MHGNQTRICTWKLNIKGTVKMCVRNKEVTEEMNLRLDLIVKPLGKLLGSSDIYPFYILGWKKVELRLFFFQDWFSWVQNQNFDIKPGEHSICPVSSCSTKVISCTSTWQVRCLSPSLVIYFNTVNSFGFCAKIDLIRPICVNKIMGPKCQFKT